MKHRTIGCLQVSVIGLGCNQLGTNCDARTSRSIVDRAVELGINFFDTAEEYGDGDSEIVLGAALRNRRHQAVIATKFAGGLGGVRSAGRASGAAIKRSLHGSLQRLGTDYIDLYQLHFPDPETRLEETLGALNDLICSGEVREIGCCNLAADQIEEASRICAALGLRPFASAQNRLNLMRQEALKSIVPVCRRHRMAFLPYFPLAAGLLTGKYRKGETPAKDTRFGGRFVSSETAQRILTEEMLERVARITMFAESRGRTTAGVALAWLLAEPMIPSVIAGATRPEQLTVNVEASEWTLTATEVVEVAALACSCVAADFGSNTHNN